MLEQLNEELEKERNKMESLTNQLKEQYDHIKRWNIKISLFFNALIRRIYLSRTRPRLFLEYPARLTWSHVSLGAILFYDL